MNLYDYFDRISIIHLPERKDRYDALSKELRKPGIDIQGPKWTFLMHRGLKMRTDFRPEEFMAVI